MTEVASPTTDRSATINRLCDLGVSNFLIASACEVTVMTADAWISGRSTPGRNRSKRALDNLGFTIAKLDRLDPRFTDEQKAHLIARSIINLCGPIDEEGAPATNNIALSPIAGIDGSKILISELVHVCSASNENK